MEGGGNKDQMWMDPDNGVIISAKWSLILSLGENFYLSHARNILSRTRIHIPSREEIPGISTRVDYLPGNTFPVSGREVIVNIVQMARNTGF